MGTDVVEPSVAWGWLAVVNQWLANWGKRQGAASNNPPKKEGLTLSPPMSILFTDIVGFTTRMAAHPPTEVVANLDQYFQILSHCVGAHNGRVDKFIGDGMMAVFDRADDAVRAAYALQRKIACFNANQVARQSCIFPTRIAVDTGPVIVTQLSARPDQAETVFGQAVNLAAHLVQQAPVGRTLISQNSWSRLADSYSYRNERRVVIKGESDPIIVYEM